MRKKNELNEIEKNEFRDAMRGVKPLKQTKIQPLVKPTPVKKREALEPTQEEGFIFSNFEKLDPVSTDEMIRFNRPGISHKVLRKLRLGQYNVQAVLDLHGMSAATAEHELSRFLYACQEENIRNTLIIHGKGRDNQKPVLKNKLNHWLRQTEQVLAFCSATPRQGRGGALYVLLKGRSRA